MRTNVKFSNKKFIINKDKETVTCMLDCDMQLYSPKTPQLNVDVSIWKKKHPEVSWNGEFKVTAVAYCSDLDTFDELKGKRIAESKAKREAFLKAKDIYNKIYNINSYYLERLNDLWNGCRYAAEDETVHIKELDR